ncbi:isochorismate synthase [Rhodospirillum sp. A1_3_36]|uniref:isochorismate synthase n=1 Tax=Rhodospirillum sp. A1_3_36 TaxID=3391666 RepID=UPI0039A73FE9
MNQISPFHLPFLSLRKTFERAIERARKQDRVILASASFAIDPLDPLRLLEGWDDGETPFFYWEGRDPDLTFLAWGCTLDLKAWGEQRFTQIGDRWRALCEDAVVEGPRSPFLCGGFRFDPSGPRDGHWQTFDDASMMVANVTVLRQGEDHQILCQHLVSDADDPIALAAHYTATLLRLHRLPRSLPQALPQTLPQGPTPPPISEQRAPGETVPLLQDREDADRLGWEEKVEDAVRHIRAGHFEKVVLARAQVQATGEVAPWHVIGHLRQHQGDTHLFACRRGHFCFLGSTPERLASLGNGHLRTHALAGTIARGTSPAEDTQLGQALLDSSKDRHEHSLVVDAVRTALRPLCRDLEIPGEPVLKRLPRVQHLNTTVRGRPLDGVGLMDLLQALHPTPAVGGHPRVEAMEYIRQHENLDRGWYAAPVGWLDGAGDGDFLVALRSALVGKGEGRLFAGCGLVGESHPAHEYRETRMKVRTMDMALRTLGATAPV